MNDLILTYKRKFSAMTVSVSIGVDINSLGMFSKPRRIMTKIQDFVDVPSLYNHNANELRSLIKRELKLDSSDFKVRVKPIKSKIISINKEPEISGIINR